MTEEQQKALSENLPGLLRFYQNGMDKSSPPMPGGFAKLFKQSYPNLYEENKKFIYALDRIIISFYRHGNERISPPLSDEESGDASNDAPPQKKQS